MKFLLEKETGEFNKVGIERNKKAIKKYIAELPNYNKVRDAELEIQQSIMEYGIDPKNNKFLDYIHKVKWDLNPATADVIYQLIDNGNLNPKAKWLYSRSLYNDTPENINYKLKALVYASKPELQKGANKEITPGLLMDKSGKIKSVEDIKKIISKIKVSDNKATDGVSVQQAIERNFGSRDITKQQNQQMIKNSLIKEIESNVNLQQKLPSGFENKLAKFDLNSIKNDIIARDTKRALAAYVLKVLRAKDNEFSTSNSGKDILRVKLGKNNFTTSNIIDYVASLVPETERDIIKTTLSTDKGKSELATILGKDYSDTNLGDDITPLDMLNSALKAKFMTPEKSNQSSKEIDKRTGQQILMQDVGIKAENGVFDFVNQTIDESNIQSVKKDILKRWLKTNDGKRELVKILKRDYSSTLMGSDLDSMKADIEDLILKAEK